ncbi:MAG: hypothetical protein ACRCUT_06030 [Spirochaetota bacterium]
MIRLKNGAEIQYDQNFDTFFQRLLASIISESINAVNSAGNIPAEKSEYNKILAKEIMDNSIFVTHQIFELSKVNQNLSKFLVTGFLFNSIILSIPNMSDDISGDTKEKEDIVH